LPLTVLVLGAGAPQLADLLRPAGLRTMAGPVSEMAALAAAAPAGAIVLAVDVRAHAQLPDLAPARKARPDIGTLLVMATLDPGLMLEAMRAGINECVAEPLSTAALEAAIRRVGDRHSAPAKPGRIIALVGAKGGLGTTTLATNIATALAGVQPGGSLLMDLHAGYGDAGLFLGVEPRFSIADALANAHRLDQALFRDLVVRASAGPDLLAAPPAETASIDTERLRTLVAFASRLYRFVVLDCPRAASVLDALDVATTIILVTSQELTAVRNAGQLMGDLERRCVRSRVMLVITRFDGAADIAPRDIEQTTGRPIQYVLPSDYRRCLDALNKGRPLVLANHNRLAGAVTRLAHDLADLRSDRATARGLFERFTIRPAAVRIAGEAQ
jgi:pilus assembly protein CpaE